MAKRALCRPDLINTSFILAVKRDVDMIELEQAIRAGIETIGLIHSLAEIEEK